MTTFDLVFLQAPQFFSYSQQTGRDQIPAVTDLKSETLVLLRSIWNRVARLLVCAGSVAAVTYAGFYVFHANALVTGVALILIVLIVAGRWGLFESMMTSIVAMLYLDYYFLPPLLSLRIAEPQNCVGLFVFI